MASEPKVNEQQSTSSKASEPKVNELLSTTAERSEVVEGNDNGDGGFVGSAVHSSRFSEICKILEWSWPRRSLSWPLSSWVDWQKIGISPWYYHQSIELDESFPYHHSSPWYDHYNKSYGRKGWLPCS